ncbi:hypothetical protein KXR53_14430 [Inquilinus limosus]|uniref:calcium-binding protein n=1 Tax=Inquilinus limosus TaxID=171674 RepID=UPI003F176D32
MPVFSGTAAADRIVGSAEADQIYGLAGDDKLYGADGNDWLVGGLGADIMVGGLGDDSYDVDSAGDQVVERAGEGTDRVRAWISHQLAANVEILTLAGTADINGFGNALNNTIIGNAGNNVLNGGAGDDAMAGGAGDDVYDVDSAGDTVVEAAGEGHDRVRSPVSWQLGANVEDLTLGGTGDLIGTGNALSNMIIGNAGNNVLNGNAGDDVLIGRAGNDVYDVDSAGDQVQEAANEGYDRIRSSVSYQLSSNIEELNLTGTAENGIGNALANTIVGNAGANVLTGGAGDDVLIGRGGNDTYDVDSAGDKIQEDFDQGRDLVLASISYQLGANVEDLTLTGLANINGIGNLFGNTITGNSGDNILNGGLEADILVGGGGNDIYEIFSNDASPDRILEMEDGGIDLVVCTIGVWQLAENVENLILTGKNALGYGNGLANVISGSAWDNDIRGEGGNDTIIGDGGFDTLSGGTGDDIIQAKDGARWIDGDEGNDRITTGSGVTIVEGGAGDDIIDSDASFWSISGDDGSDVIRGGSGDNIILGGRDDDYLSGGLGADEFRYVPNPNGVDTIADFSSSEGDKLAFWDMLHGTFSYLGSAAFTASGNSEARFAGGQALVDTDGNGTADTTINLTGFTSASQLQASDFVFS